MTYKYKIGNSSLNCTASGGYSAAIARATNITNSLTGYSSGTTIKICVLAVDAAGNQQAFSAATTTSWTRYVACNNAAASFGGGFGAVTSPYLIYNNTQLDQVRNNRTCFYRLEADLDLTAVSFAPIGTNAAVFSGGFDGNNHSISNWTYINTSADNVGFFGYLLNYSTPRTVIKDLSLININVTGRDYVGGLVGQNGYGSSVIRCKTSGSVRGTMFVGGLVGLVSSYDFTSGIFNSSSSAAVVGNYAGGLIGYLNGYSNIVGVRDSYATGAVSTPSINQYAGGLIGYFSVYGNNNFVIANSYSSGSVTATYPGGLVSYLNTYDRAKLIKNSFSTSSIVGNGGGITVYTSEYNGPNILHEGVFWDITRSGKSFCTEVATDPGCTGVNAANSNPNYFFNSANAPFNSSSIQNWDTTKIWNFSGSALPTLRPNAPVAPFALQSSGSGSPNTGITVNLSGYSPEGATFTYEILTAPANGTLSAVSGSTVTYTQNDIHAYGGFNDTFTFRVVDSNGIASLPATATVYVSPGCDPNPVIAFSGGSGVSGDPYLIGSSAELLNVQNVGHCDYQLTSNIDLSSETLTPLFGNDNGYGGVFDGNGYEISNWSYTTTDKNNVGFIGYINGGTIKNLTLSSVNISNTMDTIGAYSTGGAVGYMYYGTISNVHVSGNITGYDSVGGLVGSHNYASIEKSSTQVNVTCTYNCGGVVGAAYEANITTSSASGNVSGDYYVGGLAGNVGGYGIISNSYATGNVYAGVDYGGGFVGYMAAYYTSFHMIQNSYSSGSVSGGNNLGGFVGYLYAYFGVGILNSFSTGFVSGITNLGGFAGFSEDSSSGSVGGDNIYWDITNSGHADCNIAYSSFPLACNGVNSGSTQPTYFYNNSSNAPLDQWDFSTVWNLNTLGLPTLQ